MDTGGKVPLIHAKTLHGVYLLDTQTNLGNQSMLNHNNFTNRMRKRRWIIQISALSTFDGTVEAYHGYDG